MTARRRDSPRRAEPDSGATPPPDPGAEGGREPGHEPGPEQVARPAPEQEPRQERPAEEEAPARGLLALRLGEASFGVWIDEVLEIVRTPPISRLPLASREVAGVTSVRGDVIPVLDLGVRLLDAPAVRPGRLVLVRRPEGGSIVGLLVDGVDSLLPVRDDEIREIPAAAESRLPAKYVTGVVASEDEVVTILHLGRATAPPDPTTDEG